MILFRMGELRRSQGRSADARICYERAVAVHDGSGELRGRGRALVGMGHTFLREDRFAEATAHYERALADHRRQGEHRFEGIALMGLATAQMAGGAFERARESYERALEIQVRVRDRGAEAWSAAYLADLEHALGRLDAAWAHCERSLKLAREIGNRPLEGIALGVRGNLSLEEGRTEEAILAYEHSLTILEPLEHMPAGAKFLGCLGAARALRGRIASSKAAFEAAAKRLQSMPDQRFSAAAVRVWGGHLDVAEARLAAAAGQSEQVHAHLDRARERLAETSAAERDHLDVRFAARLLERFLSAELVVHPSVVPPSPLATVSPEQSLIVEATGRWFQPPQGKRVNLERRRSLRLIVKELAARRRAGNGRALPVAELVAHGWPGERLHPESAAERGYTAVAMLRRLGLRDILQSRDDGYLFDLRVPFVLAVD
jgi:tetratricopeptide (TPR) repeat protein